MWCAMALVICVLLVSCNASSGSNSAAGTSGGAGTGSSGSSGTGSGGSSGSSSGGSGSTTGNVSEAQGPVVYASGNLGNGVQMAGFIDARVLDVSSGALSPVPGSPFSTGYSNAGDMALAPSGAFAYLLAQQFPPGQCCVGPTFVLVYSLDPSSGAPTLKQSLATSAALAGPSNLTVHPSGQFVYAANYYQSSSGPNGIGIFTVQSDGTLVFSGVTALAQAQVSTGAVIDPNGKFLYIETDGLPVVNLGNNACGLFYSNVWAYNINSANGALTLVTGSPFTFQRNICEVGHAPQWLTGEIDPSGQRLFWVDSGNRAITVFAIDSSSGALTLLPGSTEGTGNNGPSFTAAAMDPQGRFLYVGGPSYAFTGFSLTANPASGDLPVLPGMPVQVVLSQTSNAGSRYMAIDPSGTFVFGNENEYTSAFSCCDPDPVVELRIDPNTGALTDVSSATFTLAGSASKIVVASPR
jgi:6-phosphogluconolactonase